MDPEEQCRQLEAQISELQKARDAAETPDAKNDLQKQIDALRNLVEGIRINVADNLAGKINRILAKLEDIRTEHNLDAVAALGRSIRGLRDVARRV